MAHNTSYKRTANYFYFKLGFTEDAYKRVFSLYEGHHNIVTANRHDDTCTIIQKDWNAFMNWWGTVKDKFKDEYFKAKLKRSKKYKYNEWNDIREALQYTNGCADDF